jgi:hypothetical protein
VPLPRLEREPVHRLCHILSLPSEVGDEWRASVKQLYAEFDCLPDMRASITADECLAAAYYAFEGVRSTKAAHSSALQLFGRQIVSNTVTTLRRILNEVEWPAGKTRARHSPSSRHPAAVAGCPPRRASEGSHTAPSPSYTGCHSGRQTEAQLAAMAVSLIGRVAV